MARRRGRPDGSVFDQVDDWLDRVQIVDAPDDQVAKFLDSIDLHGPQEREMLQELARNSVVARPDELEVAHKRAVEALETLGRHGYRSAVLPGWLKPKFLGRFFVELVARYVVVSYLRQISTNMRNLYWLRAMQCDVGAKERKVLTRCGIEATAMMTIFKRRSLGLPSFVIGGILVPLVLTLFRLARGFHLDSWWAILIFALVGAAIVFLISSIVLRGAAMASRRIRLSTRGPLMNLWSVIGFAGNPPRDQSRKFAILAIVITTLMWLVVPAVVAIAVLR
jgi:hypothetical protein